MKAIRRKCDVQPVGSRLEVLDQHLPGTEIQYHFLSTTALLYAIGAGITAATSNQVSALIKKLSAEIRSIGARYTGYF